MYNLWVIFLAILLMLLVPYNYKDNAPTSCTIAKTPSHASEKKVIPEDEEKAFFLETKGDKTLNYRQACAVESLALLNPDLPVYVLFADGRFDNTTVTLRTLQQYYKNVNLVHINLEDYVAGTPLESWNRDSGWRQGPYPVTHLSDGLRMLTLAKYGGYYFDLDIIFTRPVTYYRNFVAIEDDYTLNGAAIHAERGYPLIQMAVEDFSKNYK